MHNHALSHEVAIVVAVFGGVDRHKHVGHNATAAINGAAVAQCGHTQRIGKVNAIGARQFAAFITVHDVHFIVKAVAFLVWLLYASPRRSVVSSHREAYHAAILEAQRTLHKALAKGAASHNHTTVPVLHGASEADAEYWFTSTATLPLRNLPLPMAVASLRGLLRPSV